MLFDNPNEALAKHTNSPNSKTSKATPSTKKLKTPSKATEGTQSLDIQSQNKIPPITEILSASQSSPNCEIKQFEVNSIALYQNNILHHAILLPAFYGLNRSQMLISLLSRMQHSKNDRLTPINLFSLDSPDSGPHSNAISVSQVREAVSFIGKTSYSSSAKFVIISNTSNLKKEACNALLKSLEEPPKSTFIILLYTSLDGVLETIRSRTLTIYFKNTQSNLSYITHHLQIPHNDSLIFAQQISRNNLLEFHRFLNKNTKLILEEIDKRLSSPETQNHGKLKVLVTHIDITLQILTSKFVQTIRFSKKTESTVHINAISELIKEAYKSAFTYNLNTEILIINIINRLKLLQYAATKNRGK